MKVSIQHSFHDLSSCTKHLKMVVWSVKPFVFVVPGLDGVVNPFKPPKIQSRFPLEFAVILSERKSLAKGSLVIS